MSEPASWAMSSSPRRRKRSPLRKAVISLCLALVVGLVGAGLYVWNYYDWCHGSSGSQVPVRVQIPNGATGADVVSSLKSQGILRCDLVSRLEVKKQEVSIQAGEYDLATNMSIDEALGLLSKGPTPIETVGVTIPEGLRITQIAADVAKSLSVNEQEFTSLAASTKYSLPPYLPAGSPTTEGFLFPKTYEFVKKDVTADGVIKTMLEQFKKEAQGLPWSDANRLGISPYQAVIVASMIEREAANDSERPKVASVIYNRLRTGTPLYIDATLEYVDPDPSDGLTESDLAMNSPYNTREVKGLPPTPIASPGRASLKAALSPAHTDYAYYILCGDTHRFTSSYDQFLSWKASCL